jgi:predicted phosphodiesterase
MAVKKGETKSNIARFYRDKYGMEMPSLKLARIMYNDKKLTFKSVDDARYFIRAIEGKRGNTKSITVTHPSPNRVKNPYNLPVSDEVEFEPYYIKGHSKGLIINDIHLPYQDNEALTACFNFAKKQKPDFVFINGDLSDYHGLSYFLKDPEAKIFSEELKVMQDFFDVLKKTFKCKIYFKFGNHEERYENFLLQKAHELKGVSEFNLDNIIKSRVKDVEIIKDKRLVVINGLPFIHGHEFGRGFFSPVNAARGLFLQAKHSCVKADCHTTSEHTEPNVFGNIMTTYSVGCLCGLNPKWLPINKWNHGFAMIELNKNGKNYKFRNYRIFKGEVL